MRSAMGGGMGGGGWFPLGAERQRREPTGGATDIEGRLRRHKAALLYDAAMSRDRSRVQEFLQSGADPNTADEEGRLPLHAAAFAGDLKVLEQLLDSKADCNLTQGDDMPLQIAAWHGHADACKMLLEAGAKVDAADGRGSTPLCGAAEKGRATAVQVLLDFGADPGRPAVVAGLGSVTPLQAAARGGHRKVAEVLRESMTKYVASGGHSPRGRQRAGSGSTSSSGGVLSLLSRCSGVATRLCSMCPLGQEPGTRRTALR
mmetsp:Transcript_171022/g.548039  ORF Transcript_171022/g.548039 Transcript_171022/m.548039 type:complete len:260 (-) Transcript_171022:95-874(-)